MKIIKSKKYKKIAQNFYNRNEDYDPRKQIDPETNRSYDDPLVAPDDPYPNKGVQYVSVYEVVRAYGGPEEGGWWYDNFSLVDTTPVSTLEAAQKLRDFLKQKLEGENQERGPLDSSKGFGNLPEGTEDWEIPRGYSGEASELVVEIEDEPGQNTTKERPHYE